MQSSASRLVAPVLLEVKLKQDEAVLEPLIPEGLWWVYLVAPPLFVATLDAKLLLGDLDTLLRALISTYIHTFAIAGSLHVFYLHVLPRAFTRVKGRAMRMAMHVLTVSILVPA